MQGREGRVRGKLGHELTRDGSLAEPALGAHHRPRQVQEPLGPRHAYEAEPPLLLQLVIGLRRPRVREDPLLQTDQPKPSVNSFDEPEQNDDGSYDIYFGPSAPASKEKNWIQTVPGKGWFTYIRLYGPLEPFFDQTWKPDDIVEVG